MTSTKIKLLESATTPDATTTSKPRSTRPTSPSVVLLNSRLRYRDILDGSTHTILIGEMIPDRETLGWASGTRATLRNTGGFEDFYTRRGGDRTMIPMRKLRGGRSRWVVSGAATRAGRTSAWPMVRAGFSATTLTAETYQQLGNRADGKLMKRF